MMTPLYVVIAACGQSQLLRRTLTSIAECEKPAGYEGIIVAENGPQAGLEQVVAEFPAEHRFQYLYSEPANKSLALNRAIAQLGKALVVFTDDDVRVPRGTLAAYARGATGIDAGEFYGGPITPDLEGPPPAEWLRALLPRSAAGWQLDAATKTKITQPEFIGPNFAAFAADIMRIGGFDPRLGPGRHMASPGEDTEIQERLLTHGVRGYYLPDAEMNHLVRAANATIEFAIHRAERNGVYWGISAARRTGFVARFPKIYGQWLNDRLRVARWRRAGVPERQVRADCLEARWRGRWIGIRTGWRWGNEVSPAIKQAA